MEEPSTEDVAPAVEPPIAETEERVETDFGLFLHGIGASLSRIPLWLIAWLGFAVLTLVVALPWQGWMAETTNHNYEPGSQLHHLTRNFRTDHADAMGVLNSATGQLGAGLALIAGLLGVFLAGGWLQVLCERPDGNSVRYFFRGGARYFFRFVRFGLLALLVLAACNWALYDWPWDEFVLGRLLEIPESDYDSLETLASETDARLIWGARHALAALCFAGVLTWGTYARTRMALRGSRAAVWSGVCAFFFMLRHPIKTLRPHILLFLLELLVVTVIAGGVTRWLDETLATEPEPMTVVFMFAVGQLALMWREITRGARYYSALQVCREFLPIDAPDASRTIGGPGGPQYPVDDDGDEYEVAL